MGLLALLREQGVRVTADGDRLVVSPKSALTDATRTTIRINKGAILRELAAEAEDRRKAIGTASEQAQLGQYREALILGRLHLCGNCAAFQFGSDPAGLGRCSRFNVEAAPFLPFWCTGYESSAPL